jgi:D-alanine-D-alanine ligase
MKKNIAIMSGGYSGEAQISVKSAAMVMNNIDRSKYNPFLVHVSRESWSLELEGSMLEIDKTDFSAQKDGIKIRFDGVLMMIHGTPGEDGLMQGYFEMLNIPCTTGDVLNMSLTFNKKLTTRVLASMGYHTAKSLTLKQTDPYSSSAVLGYVGLPCFVKPNCGGSSIGASKVEDASALHLALELAFREGAEVIIEEFIEGTEVTSGVIVYKNQITALPLTEIVSKKRFFDFEAKYQGASEEITPARINPELSARIQRTSEEIFQKLNCRGMIRIDYLIRGDEFFVIEVNTVPGFTEASIIPQQAAAAGISKTALIDAILTSTMG